MKCPYCSSKTDLIFLGRCRILCSCTNPECHHNPTASGLSIDEAEKLWIERFGRLQPDEVRTMTEEQYAAWKALE